MGNTSEIYQNLLKERERLTKELADLDFVMKPGDERREGGSFGKREEGATEVAELEKRLALRKELTNSLDRINHAISKYEKGTYGICDQCGKRIEPARLEALPYAALCLACKAGQGKNIRSKPTR